MSSKENSFLTRMNKSDRTLFLVDFIFFLITLIISIIDFIFINFSPSVFIFLLITQLVMWPINDIIGVVTIVKTTKGNKGKIYVALNMIISMGFLIADGILLSLIIDI